MKRALVVSAGTVAGLVVSLSYTPGLQLVVAAGAPPKHGAKAQGKADASLKAVEQASRTGERAGTHPGRKNDKAPSAGNEKGSSRPKPGTATQPSGAGTEGTSSSGPGTSSSGTGDKPADNGSKADSNANAKPKPKPSTTSDPKPSPKPSPPAQPKTFTGQVVSTAFGPVQVSIVVLSGRITDVATLQSPSADPRSVEIAKNALPVLRSEALAAQSAQIAAVSGATYTSKGWISSLQSALVKAGL